MENEVTKVENKMSNILAGNAVKSLAVALSLSKEEIMEANARALQLESDDKLKSCDKFSIVRFCYEAVRHHFTRDDCLYAIPYGGAIQAQVGYRGYKESAMRSGRYKLIDASIVYSNDTVKRDRDTGKIEVTFNEHYDPTADVVGYYAFALDLDGKIYDSKYMAKSEVMAHGIKWSKTYKNGPWQTSFDQMAKKTVIKQLCNIIPTNEETQSLIKLDQAVIKGSEISYEDNPQNDEPQARVSAGRANDTAKNTPSVPVEPKTDEEGQVIQSTTEKVEEAPISSNDDDKPF